jgi:hypothetical protein
LVGYSGLSFFIISVTPKIIIGQKDILIRKTSPIKKMIANSSKVLSSLLVKNPIIKKASIAIVPR